MAHLESLSIFSPPILAKLSVNGSQILTLTCRHKQGYAPIERGPGSDLGGQSDVFEGQIGAARVVFTGAAVLNVEA